MHPLDRPTNKRQQRAIDRANRLRGMLVGSYSQAEFLMSELWVSMAEVPPYLTESAEFPWRPENRIKKTRSLFGLDGPLAQYRESADPLFVEMEEYETNRHILAHGYLRLHGRSLNDYDVEIRCFRPTESDRSHIEVVRWTLNRMEAEAKKASNFAGRWMKLHWDIHEQFGWIGNDA